MDTVFLKVLNMSISASFLIVAVLLMRLLLRNAPKWTRFFLWAITAIRLVLPFSIESSVSLLPADEVIPNNIAMMKEPALQTGIPVFNQVINPVIARQFAPNPDASVNPLQVVSYIASIVWIIGIAAMLTVLFASFLRAKHTVSVAIMLEDGVYVCDEVNSPFILGVFRPRIYLPSDLSNVTRDNVLKHEKAHLLRGDHWWKPLGFLILAIHWFNPLCWIAYFLFCRDIESSCDEKVIAKMDKECRAAYSQALLDCSRPRRVVTIFSLAFGETGVKNRVTSVLHYKKPLLWVIIVAVLACAVLAVCFLTNPKTEPDETAPVAAVPTAPVTQSPTEQPTAAVTQEPTVTTTEQPPAPMAEQPTAPVSEKQAETPAAGNGHWYTFQYVPGSGMLDSLNRRYKPLTYPYYVSTANAFAIGKVKNVPTEVRVYASDPEERVIWAYVPDVFYGQFIRSDIPLPVPDFENGSFTIDMDGFELHLSDAASTELLALMEKLPSSGESVQIPESEHQSHVVEYPFQELPGLLYWTFMSIENLDGRLYLISWKETQQLQGYEPDRSIEIDPGSHLYQECKIFE